MHKNMNLLVLKNKFQQKSLILRHIFYLYSQIVLVSTSDCELWPNFSH